MLLLLPSHPPQGAQEDLGGQGDLLVLGWQGQALPVALPCQGSRAGPCQAHRVGLLDPRWRGLVALGALVALVVQVALVLA